jgi:hypothetical protein
LALLCPCVHPDSIARISRPLRQESFEEVDVKDHRTAIFSLNSACAADSFISLPPTFTDSSPPSRPRFRLVGRHTLPQLLSRVRSSSEVPIMQASYVSPMPVMPWRRDGVFGPAHFCARYHFATTFMIRLINIITAAVPISQASRAYPKSCQELDRVRRVRLFRRHT